jgi:hypothetical protein
VLAGFALLLVLARRGIARLRRVPARPVRAMAL